MLYSRDQKKLIKHTSILTRQRTLFIALTLFSTLLINALASPTTFTKNATVASPNASEAVSQNMPVDLTGEFEGAPYRIQVPANWNGTLLVYVHGYRDKADHPGEVDDRSVDDAQAQQVLALGYALASSALRDNGWAVREGVLDIKYLTRFFHDHVATPQRTILLGFSMGSVITLASMERYGDRLYDGAIAGCAVGAGTSRSWDLTADFLLAYDVVFGMPPVWGNIGDVRDDLDFETEVAPKLVGEISNPLNFGLFEFIRLVSGTPGRGITPPPPFSPQPFFPRWVLADMKYATEYRAELERRAGGRIVQNLNHTYSLTIEEKAYLALLGLNAEPLLAAMNAQTNISAESSARNYLTRHADYTGNINRPVLTLHTIIDELIPVSHESAYRGTVTAAGRENLLFQTYTNGIGHCNFTSEQLLTALVAIDRWVRTDVRPVPSDFPAALGFDPWFTPPPFPQP
ncbi:MAG: hypothetical protein M3458_02335 [Acidobacteriota bacterium]|nr:hypothetical protein [Acidobacteriota bacterium]